MARIALPLASPEAAAKRLLNLRMPKPAQVFLEGNWKVFGLVWDGPRLKDGRIIGKKVTGILGGGGQPKIPEFRNTNNQQSNVGL